MWRTCVSCACSDCVLVCVFLKVFACANLIWQDLQPHQELQGAAAEKSYASEQMLLELRSRNELLEAEGTDLRSMVANLRLGKEDLEQHNLRLHAEDVAREDVLKHFFEQASPTLAALGWPLSKAPAEATASSESTATQLGQIAT